LLLLGVLRRLGLPSFLLLLGVLRGLGHLGVFLMLFCVGRSSGSEEQKQNCRADYSN
jgi:hypothetical protein